MVMATFKVKGNFCIFIAAEIDVAWCHEFFVARIGEFRFGVSNEFFIARIGLVYLMSSSQRELVCLVNYSSQRI